MSECSTCTAPRTVSCCWLAVQKSSPVVVLRSNVRQSRLDRSLSRVSTSHILRRGTVYSTAQFILAICSILLTDTKHAGSSWIPLTLSRRCPSAFYRHHASCLPASALWWIAPSVYAPSNVQTYGNSWSQSISLKREKKEKSRYIRFYWKSFVSFFF